VTEILIYIVDMERPISLQVQEIVEGAEESGIGSYISFRDASGREGMVLLNPDKVAAVVISAVDEQGQPPSE
jgi:hypothetical protein